MTEAPNKCSAHSRCSAWDVLIGALYQGSEGPGRHPGTTPPVPLGALAQELCMSLCLLRAPRPRDSPVLSLVSDYPTSPTGSHSHPFLFPCFLSTPEEDPCACESIVKFQTEVEGLLQALTRKHILPRDHCGSREGCGERRGSHV